MKTEDLIRALAVDRATPAPVLGRSLSTSLALGIFAALGVYAAVLGLRPHLLSALSADPRISFKIGLMLLLAALTAPLVMRLARPEAKLRSGSSLLLMMVPALLLIAVVLELVTVPEATWGARLIGHNAAFCLRSIPLLALAPFCALLFALRQGAPSRPALTGAAAGLLAGAIGATLYATHCPDDSPLFVAVWYTLGIAIITSIGALTGARLLRW